ncbi:Sister chromatid cohesion protein 2 [Nowakowskiella sp. JEL0407]|nr:Sister chromatid cohesion protein 2 [Nowakowskiella sp. JEL0407]
MNFLHPIVAVIPLVNLPPTTTTSFSAPDSLLPPSSSASYPPKVVKNSGLKFKDSFVDQRNRRIDAISFLRTKRTLGSDSIENEIESKVEIAKSREEHKKVGIVNGDSSLKKEKVAETKLLNAEREETLENAKPSEELSTELDEQQLIPVIEATPIRVAIKVKALRKEDIPVHQDELLQKAMAVIQQEQLNFKKLYKYLKKVREQQKYLGLLKLIGEWKRSTEIDNLSNAGSVDTSESLSMKDADHEIALNTLKSIISQAIDILAPIQENDSLSFGEIHDYLPTLNVPLMLLFLSSSQQFTQNTLFDTDTFKSLMQLHIYFTTVLFKESSDLEQNNIHQVIDSVELITQILQREKIDEEDTIKLIYNCISSFFNTHQINQTSYDVESKAVNKLRYSLLPLLQLIFAIHPQHRIFILEEILTNLINFTSEKVSRQFELIGGGKIQMISAVFLKLVMSVGEKSFVKGLRRWCMKFEGDVKEDDGVIETDSSGKKLEKNGVVKPKKDDNEAIEELNRLDTDCKKVLESAQYHAIFFLKYLLGRCHELGNAPTTPTTSKRKSLGGPAKSKAAGMESEYKQMLENILKDVLFVLGDPEWPGADIVANAYCKIMIQYVDDSKPDPFYKTIALEWFGQLCHQLQIIANRPTVPYNETSSHEKSFPETLSLFIGNLKGVVVEHSWSEADVEVLWSLQWVWTEWLLCEERDDRAAKFLATEWLCNLLPTMEKHWKSYTPDYRERMKLLLMSYCEIIWGGTPLFQPHPTLSSTIPMPLTKLLSISQLSTAFFEFHPIAHSFSQYIKILMNNMESEVVSIRVKCLKLLMEIVSADKVNEVATTKDGKKVKEKIKLGGLGGNLRSVVKNAVKSRLFDASTSVRDAAIEFVGKCFVGDEKEFYEVLKDRILDVGVNVRKRIIKLMRDIYTSIIKLNTNESRDANFEILVDICCRMMGRFGDEEETVRDLALKTMQELWFSQFTLTSCPHSKLDTTPQQIVSHPSRRTISSFQLTALAEIQFRARILSRTVSISGSTLTQVSELLHHCVVGGLTKQTKIVFFDVCVLMVGVVVEECVKFEEAENSSEKDDEATKHTAAVQRKKQFLEYVILLKEISTVFGECFTQHLETFRPYLKSQSSTTTSTDKDIIQLTNLILQNILLMFQNTIQKSELAKSFLMSLETDLLRILNFGTNNTLLNCVSCLCAVVKRTEKYEKLVKSFKVCIEGVLKFKKVYDEQNEQQEDADGEMVETSSVLKPPIPINAWKMVWRCLIVSSRILRFFDFDQFTADAEKQGGADRTKEISDLQALIVAYNNSSTVSAQRRVNSILEMVHNLIFQFAMVNAKNDHEKTLKSISINSMGQLFISYPKLMLRESTRKLMDSVFVGDGSGLKLDLMKSFVEFLEIEKQQSIRDDNEVKQKQQEQGEKSGSVVKKRKLNEEGKSGININVLIGNAQEMGDAGVSSSIMQLYLEKILECLLSEDSALQQVSFECVVLILEQGLVHPLLCVPALVAIESGYNESLRDRAFKIHQTLNEKHASFIHTKNIDSVLETFNFQVMMQKDRQRRLKIADDVNLRYKTVGYQYVTEKTEDGHKTKPAALIWRLYSLVQSKRAKRNGFLANMIRAFDIDTKETDPSKIDVPFIKFVAENVATLEFKTQEEVLYVIHRCLRIISVQGESIDRQIESWENPEKMALDMPMLPVISKMAACMSILLILKNHLQIMYNMNDQRCLNFTPSESKRAVEKSVIKNENVSLIHWDKVLFATKEMETEEDYKLQCEQFHRLMGEDYTGGIALEDFYTTDYQTYSESDTPGHTSSASQGKIQIRKRKCTTARKSSGGEAKKRRTSTPIGGGLITKEDFEPVSRAKRRSLQNVNYIESDSDEE